MQSKAVAIVKTMLRACEIVGKGAGLLRNICLILEFNMPFQIYMSIGSFPNLLGQAHFFGIFLSDKRTSMFL